jgi:hypothetical protein
MDCELSESLLRLLNLAIKYLQDFVASIERPIALFMEDKCMFYFNRLVVTIFSIGERGKADQRLTELALDIFKEELEGQASLQLLWDQHV